MALDPYTGLPTKRNRLYPDFDPTGRVNIEQGDQLMGPLLAGLSPTGPGGSYRDLLSIPGTQPDFLGILNADPFLQQARSSLGAQGVADRAQRDALIRQGLIRFGQVPDFNQSAGALGLPADELSGIANAETRALAEQNTAEGLSTTARLERERQRGAQNIADVLAARGGLRSGAYGVALKDLQQDYKQAEFDAVDQLLGYLTDFQQGYVQGQRQRKQQLAAEQQAAVNRFPVDQLAGTQPEEADFAGYDANGNRVYRGRRSGRHFLEDKSPYDGQVLATPPSTQPPPEQRPDVFLGSQGKGSTFRRVA